MTQGQWADELIGRVEGTRPDVVRLAELASLAVRVDAPLLRSLRQQLLPGSDPGLEADLWFSPLIEAQDDEYAAFHEPVVVRLRERLRIRLQATDEPAFNRVYRLTRAAHAHLPEAARLEELLTAWALRAEPWDQTRMEQALAPALRALGGADEAHALEVARWAMQAAGRLPESVRALLPMQAVLVASALRLQQPALAAAAAGPVTLGATDLSWLVPAAKEPARTRLGVALVAGGVLFEEPRSGGLGFELPRTTPLVVSLRWQDTAGPHQRLATVAPGAMVAIEGEAPSIQIVTLAGDAYTLTRSPAPAATVTGAANATLGEPVSNAQAQAAPASPEGVPGAFLDGCALVEDLGSKAGPAIAFPLGNGLWVTAREPFGSAPFVGTVSGATGEQFEVVNARDENARVALLRPLQADRPGVALPLATGATGDDGWWTVTMVDGRPQVMPVRVAPIDVGEESFVVEAPEQVPFAGGPVLRGDVVVGMIVAQTNLPVAPGSKAAQVLRALAAGVLRRELERAHAPAGTDAIPAAAVTSARFLPETRHLLLAGGDGALRLYDADCGALTNELPAHEGPVLALALLRSSDGTIASSGLDRTLKISRPDAPVTTRTVRMDPPAHAIAGHPQANGLTVGAADGLLQAITSGSRGWTPYRRRDPAEPLAGGLNALAAVAEGDRFVSAADDGRLVVWREELTPSFELVDPDGPSAPALSVAATPDGRLVAAGYADRTVRLWDLPSRRVRRVMRGHHRGGVCAIAIGDDGWWVVSGGTDGSVCLWMPESEGMMAVLVEAGPRVRAVAVSGDGVWVASGDDEGTVRVWDAKPAALVRQFRTGPARVVLAYGAVDDRPLAAAIARALQERGIATYLDTFAPRSQRRREGVLRAIERSDLVVPLVSPRIRESGWFDDEVRHAENTKRSLLPVATREGSDEPGRVPDWMGSTEPLVLTPHRLDESAAEVAARIAARLEAPPEEEGPEPEPQARKSPPRRKGPIRKM